MATTKPASERFETVRGVSSSPIPSDCQVWLRVSKSSRGSRGRGLGLRGLGIDPG